MRVLRWFAIWYIVMSIVAVSAFVTVSIYDGTPMTFSNFFNLVSVAVGCWVFYILFILGDETDGHSHDARPPLIGGHAHGEGPGIAYGYNSQAFGKVGDQIVEDLRNARRQIDLMKRDKEMLVSDMRTFMGHASGDSAQNMGPYVIFNVRREKYEYMMKKLKDA